MEPRIFKTIRRSWPERLLSLTPWIATKQVRDYDAEHNARLERIRRETSERFEAWKRTMPPVRSQAIGTAPRTASPRRPPPAPPRHTSSGPSPSPAPSADWWPSTSRTWDDTPSPSVFRSGLGGEFAGAGASGGWDSSPAPCDSSSSSSPSDSGSCSSSD